MNPINEDEDAARFDEALKRVHEDAKEDRGAR